MNFTILVDPSLVIITIYLVCLEVEKKIFKEIMHFHYMTYMHDHTLAQKPLPQGT